MKKLKKIKIKHLYSNALDLDGPDFAFCSRDLKQASNFHLCRENLINEMFGFYNKSPYTKNVTPRKMKLLVQMYSEDPDYYAENEFDVYEEDLRKFKKKVERCMRRSLKLINFFERIAKWQQHTKLYEAIHKRLDDRGIVMYLFAGPGKWMRSPHMISLFTFLIRMGNFKEWDSLRSLKDFEKISKKLIKQNKYPEISYEESWPDINEHLRDIYAKIPILMKNWNRLFGKKPSRYFFTEAIPNVKSRYGEGISRLCRGCAGDKETNEAFQKILKENE